MQKMRCFVLFVGHGVKKESENGSTRLYARQNRLGRAKGKLCEKEFRTDTGYTQHEGGSCVPPKYVGVLKWWSKEKPLEKQGVNFICSTRDGRK